MTKLVALPHGQHVAHHLSLVRLGRRRPENVAHATRQPSRPHQTTALAVSERELRQGSTPRVDGRPEKMSSTTPTTHGFRV